MLVGAVDVERYVAGLAAVCARGAARCLQLPRACVARGGLRGRSQEAVRPQPRCEAKQARRPPSPLE